MNAQGASLKMTVEQILTKDKITNIRYVNNLMTKIKKTLTTIVFILYWVT